MDDRYEYATTEDGVKLRSCVWESPHIPVTWVKWCVQRYYSAFHFWRTIESGQCSFEKAFAHAPERLKWWAENLDDE